VSGEADKSLQTYVEALAEFAEDNETTPADVFDTDWTFEDEDEAAEFHFWCGYVTCAAEMQDQQPADLVAAAMPAKETPCAAKKETPPLPTMTR
jgi:hypothetical protein